MYSILLMMSYRKREKHSPSREPVTFANKIAPVIINQHENHGLQSQQAKENDYTLPPDSEPVTFTNQYASEVIVVEFHKNEQ